MGIKRRSSAPAATTYLDDDDDTVTTLRSKRRKDEDAVPAKKKARAVEPDDDEDEDEDDEEEERPRAKKAKKVKREKAVVEDDLDDEEDEDEDATPARTSSIQPGWKAAKKVLSQNRSGFADEFRFGDDDALVKFPSADPFGSFGQHWIERQGKRSFICLKGHDPKGCPLCKAGDNPRPIVAFNIIVLHEEGDVLDTPVVKALHAGPRLLAQIEAEHEGRYGPIDSNFWKLSRSGKKGSYQTSVKNVKERDLEDDWEIEPAAVEKAMKKLKLYDASIFKLPTRQELTEIAREINDGD